MATATNLIDSVRTKTMKYTHNAAVTIGELVLAGGRLLIAYDAILINAEGVYIYASGKVEAPKAAVAITSGEIAYWDSGAAVITNVVGANTKHGMFIEDALAGDANGVFELDNSVNI